jgi:transcriptional regulator with XRE-family HTH domain
MCKSKEIDKLNGMIEWLLESLLKDRNEIKTLKSEIEKLKSKLEAKNDIESKQSDSDTLDIVTIGENYFGRLLKYYRVMNNIKGAGLSRRLDKDDRYISQIEMGRCVLNDKYIPEVAEILGINSSILIEAKRIDKQFRRRLQLDKCVNGDNGLTEFGSLLRKYREESNISAAKLSRSLGKNNSYISNLERGKYTIDDENLRECCEILDIDSSGYKDLKSELDN